MIEIIEKNSFRKKYKKEWYSLKGCKRKGDILEIEYNLLIWIIEQRTTKIKYSISSKEIINKTQELKIEFIEKNYNTIYFWFCNFIKDMDFVYVHIHI